MEKKKKKERKKDRKKEKKERKKKERKKCSFILKRFHKGITWIQKDK